MDTRPKLCVLRTGEAAQPVAASRGEFFRLFQQAAGGLCDAFSWSEVDVRQEGPLPDRRDFSGFVITGSSSSVTERAPWMLRVEAWLRGFEEPGAPVLGVCFGHQLLGQALGGRVDQNPLGREIGTTEAVRLVQDDPLLSQIPETFLVNNSHRDSVVSLPVGARVLVRTGKEDVAAFAWGRDVWGVQFHPEFDAEVVRGYVEARREILLSEGIRPEVVHAEARDAPCGVRMFENYLRLLLARG